MSSPTFAITARVARLRAGQDPTLLARLGSGWAVLNERQPMAVRGACLLLPDPVVGGVNALDADARARFFRDLAWLGDAILAVTGAERVNYLVLCNQVPELHAHCIPRFAAEQPALRRAGPFEAYDFGAAPAVDPDGDDRALRTALVAALRRLSPS